MKIECVILDCDGLMFDTERISKKVMSAIIKENGFVLRDDFYDLITGTGRQEAQKVYDSYPGLNDLLPTIYQKRKQEVFYEAKSIGIAKKGLEELLTYLQNNHIKFAAATSSNREYLTTLLNSLSKPYTFSAICTGEDVKSHKPDPEVFLLAASLCNCEPANCLVLEDSKQGVIAARSAHMISGFIEDTIKMDEKTKQCVDIEFNDLSEVITYLEKK